MLAIHAPKCQATKQCSAEHPGVHSQLGVAERVGMVSKVNQANLILSQHRLVIPRSPVWFDEARGRLMAIEPAEENRA